MVKQSIAARRGVTAIVLSLVLIVLPALSCSLFSPSTDVPGTQTADALIVDQRLKQTLAVEIAKRTVQAATAKSKSSAATQKAAAKATSQAKEQAQADAQSTQQALAQETENVASQATKQAAGLAADVESLMKDKVFSTNQGTYYNLGDFDKSMAMINYVTWWKTGYEPAQFVVRADVDYETASTVSNWFNTGCGFVWWDNGEKDNYQAVVALDGNVYVGAYVKNVWKDLGKVYYGEPERPAGSFSIALVVNKKNAWVYVDGKMIKKSDVIAGSMKTGALSYTVVSGTNKDYGTRCMYKNVELWVVEE